MDFSAPWPWYVAGPLIGLTVPLLLLIGNRPFGLSSNLRHICAATLPTKAEFFNYDWKSESWNLLFVAGLILGSFLATQIPSAPLQVHENLQQELHAYGMNDFRAQLPPELFRVGEVATARGFVILVIGGLLVGFGTRYAGGCTSGHAITGLSTLQLPSLIATVAFMVGGILSANFLIPHILRM